MEKKYPITTIYEDGSFAIEQDLDFIPIDWGTQFTEDTVDAEFEIIEPKQLPNSEQNHKVRDATEGNSSNVA